MESLIQPMTISTLLITGIGVALLGSIKLRLARRLNIDETRVGGLVSAFGFTIIPMILISGFLSDHLGEQWVLIGGSFLMMAGLTLLARSPTYPRAFLAVLCLGSAWAAMVNAVNVFVPAAFGGTMAYATNLSNVFFGLGAFLTPMGLAFLLRRRPIGAVLFGLGLAALIPGILGLIVDFSAFMPAAADPVAGGGGELGVLFLLSDPILWLCALGMFFYTPLEASMGAWSTTYLGGRGVSEASALRWLSVFWLAFMSTRLVTAFTLGEGGEGGLILVLSVACVGVLTGLVLSRSSRVAVLVVVAAGLVFGPLFPTLLAVLLDHFALEVRGRAIGLFFAIGAVGWTVIPALIGARAQKTSLQQGFVFAVASAVGLTLVALVLFLHGRSV